MPTRNRAHLDTRLEAFCNDLSLDLIRPVAPTRRTFQDLKSADVAPSRSQQMLHRLFQSFAPNQNAKLAQTTPTENPPYWWGARTAYDAMTAIGEELPNWSGALNVWNYMFRVIETKFDDMDNPRPS